MQSDLNLHFWSPTDYVMRVFCVGAVGCVIVNPLIAGLPVEYENFNDTIAGSFLGDETRRVNGVILVLRW